MRSNVYAVAVLTWSTGKVDMKNLNLGKVQNKSTKLAKDLGVHSSFDLNDLYLEDFAHKFSTVYEFWSINLETWNKDLK